MDLVFDSNIVIDALNGFEPGGRELGSATRRRLSVISRIEVLAGCPTPEAERLARVLIGAMEVVGVSDEIAEEAVQIRRASRMKLPDAIILATARVLGCQLSTRNTKDFSQTDPGIRVPYEL